jgi:hypothetical protein
MRRCGTPSPSNIVQIFLVTCSSTFIFVQELTSEAIVVAVADVEGNFRLEITGHVGGIG